jgi:hypothetical protein
MDPKELFVSALKRLNKEQEKKRSPPNKADRQIKESSSKQVRQSGTVNVKKSKAFPATRHGGNWGRGDIASTHS